MSSQTSVCVFCGSSPGKSPIYLDVAKAFGKALADKKWNLVYGGGERGCMGALAASAVEHGVPTVTGVIPHAMTTSKPKGHPGNEHEEQKSQQAHSSEGTGAQLLDATKAGTKGQVQTFVVESMHERKRKMADASQGFVGLPGGYGTFEEVMEMITWSQLGIHMKPVVLLNANGFWDPIRLMIENAVQEGFITEAGAELVAFVGKKGDAPGAICEAALQEFEAMQAKLAKRGGGYFDWTKQAPKTNGTADATMADGTAKAASSDEPLAVSVPNLTFSFSPGAEPALKDCNLSLTRGSRCLLIGANGAGKSTLLRILAGKRLCETDVRVFGRDVFRNAPRGITYLGTEWAMNPVVRSDIVVSHFLDSVGGYRHKARRDRLLDILDVDLDWHMHQISDGERRRVQLCMGLMEEWDLLLLDEVTVDLDVQVRSDLLNFLAQETVERNATIIYATHIFDGLQNFPTHLVHMQLGSTSTKDPISYPPTPEQSHLIPELPARGQSSFAGSKAVIAQDGPAGDDFSPLLHIALVWLREDKKLRIEKEKQEKGGRKRGARRADETTDSEKFFSKYDYSQNVVR